MLQDYDWPGNVRELRHVVEAALALGGVHVVDRDAVELAINAGGHALLDGLGTEERQRLLAALDELGWDTARVAKRFGVHRVTVYRRMYRLGIKRSRNAGAERSAIAKPDPDSVQLPPCLTPSGEWGRQHHTEAG